MYFVVQGYVRDRSSQTGLLGLRVEAWEGQDGPRTLLGYAQTELDGRFSMRIDEDDVVALVGPHQVTAFFRVVQSPNLVLLDTRGTVEWLLDEQLAEVTLPVTIDRPVVRLNSLSPFVVRGTAYGAEGPLADHYVKAYHQEPASQQLLTPAPAQTDPRGNYRLTYTPSMLEGRPRADLVIKVFQDEACTTLVGESDVRCQAAPTVVVDVTRTNDTWLGTSRHGEVSAAVSSLLAPLDLPAITEEQRERVACSAGVDREHLDAIIGAKILSTAYPALSEGLAFALISSGVPADADGFFLHSRKAVKSRLVAALDANIVSQTLRTGFDDEMAGWAEAATAWALTPRAGKAGLRELLAAAGVPEESGAMSSFAVQYFSNEDDLASFWSGLTGGFDAARIQLALQWGAFTRGHTPLLDYWKSQYEIGKLTLLEKACGLGEADWLDVLNSGSPAIGAPSDIPGANETERRQSYARVLARTFSTALPMVTYRKRIESSTEPAAITSFFSVHATFDFGTDRLSRAPYLATVNAMSATDKRRIKGMERLFRVTPRYEETKALLDAGYFSAHQIHDKGKARFVGEMAATLGTDGAEAVFSRACYTASAAKVLFAKYGVSGHGVQLRTLPNHRDASDKTEAEGNQIPDWRTLFGNAGGCACEHCKSVLGPAAYFVDLLHWVSQNEGLEKLLDRRPDLARIKLTCKSSHTPLPYLDLVNETLEVLVAEQSAGLLPPSTDVETTYEPAELLAGPEILYPEHHIGAWTAVAGRVHPFTLPRDLWAEEAGVYLRRLGTSREDIVRTLSGYTGPPRDVQIARARLLLRDDVGVPTAGWKLVTGGYGGALSAQDLWGGLASHLIELAKVPRFISYAGLADFKELEELLATRYVNGLAGTGVESVPPLGALELSPADGCDIDAMTITGLSDEHLHRLHRFIRLARLTGLSFSDLDTLAAAFSSPEYVELTEDVVARVAAALSLAERLRLEPSQVAALYAPLDRHERLVKGSAFRRLFLNKLVDAPDVGDFQVMLATGTGTKTYAEHRASLAQALGLGADDLDLLIDPTVLPGRLDLDSSSLCVDGATTIDIDGLSKLYRVVRLARALRMPVGDLIVFHSLLDAPALASPADTEAFVEAAADLRSQRLGIPELQYALRAFAPESSGLAASPTDLAAVRAGVKLAVDAIRADTENLQDPDGVRGEALLAQVLASPTEQTQIFEVLTGRDTPSDTAWRARLAPLEPYLEETLSDAQDALAGPPGETPLLKSMAERFAHVARTLERHVRGTPVVVEKLATWTKIDVRTAHYLLGDVLRSWVDPASPSTRDFVLADEGNPQYRDYTLALLRRHALLVTGSRIHGPVPPADPLSSADEAPGELVTFGLYGAGSPLRILLLEAAPGDLTGARERFQRYLDVARHTDLRDRLAGGPDALRTILESTASSSTDMTALIAAQSGWDAAVVDGIALDLRGWPAFALREIANLRALERGVKLVTRTGLSVAQLVAYLDLDPAIPTSLDTPNVPPNARDLATIARRGAKAKVSAETWATLARTLRDEVRDRVRRALIDWLVPRVYADTTELFARMLLDPEMGDCLISSRIVAATNSVQLFVQRTFLQLEPGVFFDEDAAEAWQWMKAYRLWEANRKVFLYPENYLLPELRDDKTPLYRKLETRLRQGELTEESVEKALEEYLDGLHEIGKLEVMAMAIAEEDEDEENHIPYYTEHVVARTRSKPHRWYYCRRESDLRWGPWEKIELDIDSETVHLKWQNRRLYMFWPVLVQKPVENQKGAAKGGDDQVDSIERYDLRVAWSAYESGAFVPSKLSTSPPLRLVPAKGETTTIAGITPDTISLVPTPVGTGGGLLVAVRPVSIKKASPTDGKVTPLRAGTFLMDPCGGGTWTTLQETDDFRSVTLSTNPSPSKWYYPNYPAFGSLWANRVRENRSNTADYFEIHRDLFDTGGLMPMRLFGSHPGKYTMVAPFRPETPYLNLDRFVVEDSANVLHATFLRTIHVEWTEASKAYPGMIAGLEPEWGRAAPKSALESWADTSVITIGHEAADERYRIELFEHPHVCSFRRRLAQGGVFGLLGWKGLHSRSYQFLSTDIEDTYQPTDLVVDEFPARDVDFSATGAYSQYNWELFFHAPFAIAQALHKEGRYEEAQRWFHAIFDPTTGSPESGPRRYWKVKPFYENHDLATIQEQLAGLAIESSTAADVQTIVAGNAALQKNKDDLEAQIAVSVEDPYNPHALARYRILAYQKNVVISYIELLLDWGDSLFMVGSMETIHEALQLYLLAAELLGPRPTVVEHTNEAPGMTYADLEADLDAFSNAAVDVEVLAPIKVPVGWQCTSTKPRIPDFRVYFCIPGNDKLSGLWDRVGDRLFKLRNCLDIEGVARQIPLFQPPIDPALLVRARAAGVRFDQVLKSLAAPAPMYRFARLQAKATELASAVQDLGRALLGALEKKDAEALSMLRQGHEIALGEAERDVRKQALSEAKETLKGLERARRVVEKRHEHYSTIKYTIHEETKQLAKMQEAAHFQKLSGIAETTAGGLFAIPDFAAGASGIASPVAVAYYGGKALGYAARAAASGLAVQAGEAGADASQAGLTAGWKRRQEEWKLQAELAKREVAQIDRQIAAQEIRVAISEQEIQNLELRLTQSREVETFLRRKFTNEDLYDWLWTEIAAEHYQAYQLALDMARRAERAYQLERGESTTFIRFGQWDSLKKGLLAGERLLADLRAMDAAYLAKSSRELEITKHVALSEIDAARLRELRHGSADAPAEAPHLEVGFSLPEELFDADYPGHYHRRIKSVAVTLPAVKPALDSVQCELTMTSSEVRLSTALDDGAEAPYPRDESGDERFRLDFAPRRQLVTSAAEGDAGMFEVNLRDDMLLPFEGAGVIGSWSVRLPRPTNRFPLHLLSDVILHIRYTARDGGLALRRAAYESAVERLTSRTRMFSLRRDFPTAWALFLRGNEDETENSMQIRLTTDQFLPFFDAAAPQILGVMVSGTFSARAIAAGGSVTMALTRPGGATADVTGTLSVGPGEPTLGNQSEITDLAADAAIPRPDQPGAWTLVASTSTAALQLPNGLLAPDVFEDLWLSVQYGVSST